MSDRCAGTLRRCVRMALVANLLIGLVFVALQVFEYRDHWKTLTPYSDSYGSI